MPVAIISRLPGTQRYTEGLTMVGTIGVSHESGAEKERGRRLSCRHHGVEELDKGAGGLSFTCTTLHG